MPAAGHRRLRGREGRAQVDAVLGVELQAADGQQVQVRARSLDQQVAGGGEHPVRRVRRGRVALADHDLVAPHERQRAVHLQLPVREVEIVPVVPEREALDHAAVADRVVRRVPAGDQRAQVRKEQEAVGVGLVRGADGRAVRVQAGDPVRGAQADVLEPRVRRVELAEKAVDRVAVREHAVVLRGPYPRQGLRDPVRGERRRGDRAGVGDVHHVPVPGRLVHALGGVVQEPGLLRVHHRPVRRPRVADDEVGRPAAQRELVVQAQEVGVVVPYRADLRPAHLLRAREVRGGKLALGLGQGLRHLVGKRHDPARGVGPRARAARGTGQQGDHEGGKPPQGMGDPVHGASSKPQYPYGRIRAVSMPLILNAEKESSARGGVVAMIFPTLGKTPTRSSNVWEKRPSGRRS